MDEATLVQPAVRAGDGAWPGPTHSPPRVARVQRAPTGACPGGHRRGVLASQDAGAEAWGTAAPDPVAPAVRIAGHPDHPHRGALYLASVSTKRVTALDWLIPGLLAREVADARVVPLARLYGPHPPTAAQERAQEHRELAVGEAAAPIAAYRALGYAVPIVDGRPRLPYPTTIDDRDLAGGPSAGLMFALAVVDRLTPGGIPMGTRSPGPAPSTRPAGLVPSGVPASRCWGRSAPGCGTSSCPRGGTRKRPGMAATPATTMRRRHAGARV